MNKRLRPESSSQVSTWMRKVLDLEREAKHLKEENERLKSMESERAQLMAVLQAQNETIVRLQAEKDTKSHQAEAPTSEAPAAPTTPVRHPPQTPVDPPSAGACLAFDQMSNQLGPMQMMMLMQMGNQMNSCFPPVDGPPGPLSDAERPPASLLQEPQATGEVPAFDPALFRAMFPGINL